MQLIRVWFTKTGKAKYMSHLDLNRCMIRAVRRAQIPIWYTEGYNPHPFLTFALPLSLGIEGRRETMDMKLEGEMSFEEVCDRLNAVLPQEIQILEVREAVMKPKVIAYAQYELELSLEDTNSPELKENIEKILALPEIIVPRRTKSGVKDFDLAPEIGAYDCRLKGDGVCLSILLPAGSKKNVNPVVVVDALGKYMERTLRADLHRAEIYDESRRIFC